MTERWHLADAAFLVGLEHPDAALLEQIAHALLPDHASGEGELASPRNGHASVGHVPHR
ncbi:hypothetical protein [Streptomyces sp. HNM0574]|uniref:hypothetical protein n=1 Tax=Streptomyces sp. HNM0574 TaxID=2714954 RepID=UPI00146D6E0A|nr:hypothetical protein [Streptomyces sp. HNM0574]NLU70593.1 hypothetical protein [Streptomyces sp. HNM0574]